MNPDPILPVVMTVTVYPPKKNKRMVVVSGAPEGEMPLVLTGLFQERHALLDQAYAQCMKRKPQLVTLKAGKIDKSKSVTGDVANEEEPGNREPDDAAASDQLVSDSGDTDAVPVSPITSSEELPEIEGDTVGASHEAVALFENQLSTAVGSLDSAVIEPEEEVVNDVEQD